ncbi:MAG: UDP-N-acetylmuramoyl-L-alanyl-D-glutamate--2,6-diaminopimelate ligase [Spirochaetales bacterium]|nr:UDP-N-acetylmuramoyl-L-alanyl-D-glutamate--2,6-diaminopimelate ligase [Spirochaetales bacterium]
MQKRLSALTGKINIINKTEGDPLITGIAYDSRNVEEGFLFIALPGLHVDGHDYIGRALEQGASAVLYSEPETPTSDNAVFILTDNTRRAISPAASAFYNHPSDKLVTVGVTGTDGKTSTVYFIDQLLEMSGKKSGFISTAACKIKNTIEKNPYRQSTPEAVEINMMLSEMHSSGKTHAVIESTSHGLSPINNRLGDVSFNAAVFTNLSHEHLEFHGSLQQYRNDKANLFRKLRDDNSFGIVNLDDENADYFIKAAGQKVFTCSLKDEGADFYASEIIAATGGSSFTININKGAGEKKSFRSSISMPGLFNIENALEAFAAVHVLEAVPAEKLAAFLPELAAVKGRMKVLSCGQDFTALIDYAHTPGSFRKLFPDLRQQTAGRLIAVFGSAGERDIEKRPEQGEIAAGYADILVLTDEDPRGDDGMNIIREIAGGAKNAVRSIQLEEDSNLFLIPDRREAIQKAFSIAEAGDTVVMLGKGHESSIIYADGPRPWDEEEVAVEILTSMFR